MIMDKTLDNILNTNHKVKIIRLFISKREDFISTGREIARMIDVTAPTAHTALKELYSQDILKRNIISGHHLYKLNTANRTVKNILIPAFKKELAFKKDISLFLINQIKDKNISNKIISIILYGSFQTGKTDNTSDVDVAVVVKNKNHTPQVEKIFIEEITNEFREYFGVHLDVYIKPKEEFLQRLNKNQPPISTLIKSYSIIHGKDIIDLK